ncbi:MAG TPA: 7-carboxy-7-deazaguanine synthase QueE [Methylophaga aminisulfidivorans]|jgi:7-carboxy-7-deazaguanine synthase|uniref:7-carboxy-7-deazaguanine synthase QueE n=1 Tax=Methylophaga TaxID=40222 RepID=UPI00176FEED0|nr:MULTISPECIES: 7-carboxy-7-deazaguanine synthase QueE [Methylophaga]HIC48045.1 7-carboxy-7-deazaguanine synthase QueE [Methylophaga sp.]HIM38316.1 7-carboxy-7-deazaguanine synthase QueE [Methylophaga aminisulfidivorans]
MAQCRITEIFYSLQGESRTVGLPTVFVRLTGCPLRCGYCDTEYAFHGGEKMDLDDIVAKVAAFNPRYVCVTGGEPLAQPNCIPLLTALCDCGYEVSLETSGAMDISKVDKRVSRVMDLKTPGSGEESKNRYENIELLNTHDQLKFVVCHRDDYDWAKEKLQQHLLNERCEVLFSPIHGQLQPAELAEWVVEDNLPVRMQIQMHKYLWGEEKGR